MAKTASAAPSTAVSAFRRPFSFTIVYRVLLLVYVVLVFYGTSNHEPWRDEAQSWLLCRDLSFGGLLKILPAEGHPPLWYLLILPLAKSGAPYMLQNYLSVAIMIGTAWLLLFRTMLPAYLKIALLFSYFFLYEYVEFARSYCLVAFFTILILALYPLRFSRPWLFALAVVGLFNTHMLTFAFAGGIALLYAIDAYEQSRLKGPVLAAFGLMCVGGAYLIPYIVMGSSTSGAFVLRVKDHGAEIGKALGNAFFTHRNPISGIVAFAVLCACLTVRPKALLVLAAGMAGMCYILGYKYNGSERHHGIVMLIMVTAIGLAYHYAGDRWNPRWAFDGARLAGIVLTFTLIFQVRAGFKAWSLDNRKKFSDAKGAAGYLNNHGLEHAILVGHRSYLAGALLPFLPGDVRMWFADCGRTGSYIIYDSCHLTNQSLPNDSAVRAADSTFFKSGMHPENEVVLVLSGRIRDPRLAQDWQLVYHTPEEPVMKDEEYFIYCRRQ